MWAHVCEAEHVKLERKCECGCIKPGLGKSDSFTPSGGGDESMISTAVFCCCCGFGAFFSLNISNYSNAIDTDSLSDCGVALGVSK